MLLGKIWGKYFVFYALKLLYFFKLLDSVKVNLDYDNSNISIKINHL